jgi:hypothetical protein
LKIFFYWLCSNLSVLLLMQILRWKWLERTHLIQKPITDVVAGSMIIEWLTHWDNSPGCWK